MTLTDDDAFVTHLRERAFEAVPPSGLDLSVVLARSRRRRHASLAVQASVGLAAVVLAGVGLASVLDLRNESAVLADQEPTPMGQGQLVALAEGVTAVNRPALTTLDDGTEVLDLGLGYPFHPGGEPLVLAWLDLREETQALLGGETGQDTAVELWKQWDGRLDQLVAPIAWRADDSASDYGAGLYGDTLVSQHEQTGQALVAGVVPSWLPDPTVTLYLPAAVTLADGTTGDRVEVPTFRAPTADGRLLYVVGIDQVEGADESVEPVVVFTGSDGTSQVVGCGVEALEPCLERRRDAAAAPATDTGPQPCAEFPAQVGPGDSRDSEGWWSSSPADADGNVLQDPADWPPVMRDHPQTALVDTRTHEVVSTWDRLACGPVAGYLPPDGAAWPADSIVVLDAVTGEVVESFAAAAPES